MYYLLQRHQIKAQKRLCENKIYQPALGTIFTLSNYKGEVGSELQLLITKVKEKGKRKQKRVKIIAGGER